MKQIGDVIYQLRMQRGLTQSELSKRVNLAQANLSNIEKSKQDVTVSTLQRIVSVLGCSLEDFFREVEQKPQDDQFSRERIERIAEAIVDKKNKLSGEDKKIVEWFQALQPKLSGQVRINETYQAWQAIRSQLSKKNIQSLQARVRDAEMRAKR